MSCNFTHKIMASLQRSAIAGRMVLALLVFFSGNVAMAEEGPAPSSQAREQIIQVTPSKREWFNPSHPAAHLPLRTEASKLDYLVYHGLWRTEWSPILYLKIPRQYAGEAVIPVHNWGFSATIWYPEMTGFFHPDNQARINCPGWCKGQIHITIENEIGFGPDADIRYRMLVKSMEEEHSKADASMSFTTVKKDAQEEAYAGRYIRGVDTGKTTLFFVRRGSDGKITHFAECDPGAPSPSCDAVFESSAHNGVSVSYSFGLPLLDDWLKMQSSVDDLVNRFVVTYFLP